MNENTVEIAELFDNFYINSYHLTASQSSFIDGCKRQYKKTKELSSKQLEVLRDILRYLPEDEPIRTTSNR